MSRTETPARTERMNLIFLHRCGKAMACPTMAPIKYGVVCDGCWPDWWEAGRPWESDKAWRVLNWGDPELKTAPGVPELAPPASTD